MNQPVLFNMNQTGFVDPADLITTSRFHTIGQQPNSTKVRYASLLIPKEEQPVYRRRRDFSQGAKPTGKRGRS